VLTPPDLINGGSWF
jgi:hypothetical protein